MSAVSRPLLAYDRVDANKRTTRLLLLAFAIIALPTLAYVATYMAHVGWMMLGIWVIPDAYATPMDEEIDYQFHFTVLVACGVFSLLLLYLGTLYVYERTSALILRMTRAHALTADENVALRRKVENLSIALGLPAPRLYIIETGAINSFSTGLSPETSSLAVTRGMINGLTSLELDAVISHELSKVGNHDTHLNVTLAAMLGMLRLPAAMLVGVFRFLFRLHVWIGSIALLYAAMMVAALVLGVIWVLQAETDPWLEALLVVGAILPVYSFVLSPILASAIARAVSRGRIFLADADAVLVTRGPQALASALGKAAAAGALEKADPSLVGLFFADPLPKDTFFWEAIFDTYPSSASRIAVLAAMSSAVDPEEIHVAYQAGKQLTIAPEPATPSPLPPLELSTKLSAFRLEEVAELSRGLSPGEAPLISLAPGTLITVTGIVDGSLQVITSTDLVGFVRQPTKMTPVEIPTGQDGPEVDASPQRE